MDMGHLGDGAYGTVSKMLFPPTNTTMAVKVCVCGGGGCRDYSIVSLGVADEYRRSGNFRIRNVCTFNFRHMAKWRKLNARVRNFHAFNFRRLSNCRKDFNDENFPIYGTCFLC